jgi:hypothetical protein
MAIFLPDFSHVQLIRARHYRQKTPVDKKRRSIDFIAQTIYLAVLSHKKSADLYYPGEMGFS